MSSGVTYYSSLRVLYKSDLENLQKACDAQGYLDALSNYLQVKIENPAAIKEAARSKFLELSTASFDGFFLLRVWLKAFETHLKLEKPFFFPHIDPHILSQNKY